MSALRRHLSVANVLSCVALFVALGGAAYAVSPLGNKSVKTRNLANGAVTTVKLRGGAVTNLKLRNGAVTGSKIANGTIGSSQLASGAVRSAQLGGGVVTEAKLKDGVVSEKKLASNAVVNAKIANGAVGSTKLASSLLGQLLKNVSYVRGSSGPADTATETKTASATCPSGKQVIGGGAQIIGDATEVAITRSMTPPNEPIPMVVGSGVPGPSTWAARATDIGGETVPWSLEAFAICAEL